MVIEPSTAGTPTRGKVNDGYVLLADSRYDGHYAMIILWRSASPVWTTVIQETRNETARKSQGGEAEGEKEEGRREREKERERERKIAPRPRTRNK